ncbi:MAG: Hsp20/alpha crystallin family protein [Thainema sp.]
MIVRRRYLDPFTEFNALRSQINEVFGELTENATKATWTPAIRLVDQGNEFVLTAQLAGVKAEDLDIQVSKDAISLSGERRAAEAGDGVELLYDDTRYGSFYRVINLPEMVQNNNVQADFNHGVLTLTLPKVIEARNKVVKINLGQMNGAETPQINTATDANA